MMPLWTPDNNTPDSSVFKICPGHVALLVATGFERYRVRDDAVAARSPQLACIHRLIFEYETEWVGALEPRSACDYLFDVTRTIIHTVDDTLWTRGCLWSIGGCDNLKFLAVPGSYYLHLNDNTALGNAQVWIDMYEAKDLPAEFLKGLQP